MPRRAGSCDEHVTYVSGCAPCQERSRAYGSRRHRGLAFGTWERMVEGDDLVAVRDHVASLLAVPDVVVPLIAQAAGTTHSNVYRLMRGEAQSMRPDLAQALSAVTADMALRHRPESAFVDSIGAARRLQCLAADDWSSEALSPLCGVRPVALGHWRARRCKTIRAESHRIVVDLYDKIRALADPRGPSPMAGQRAREFGYLPPERWADEDLDDPNAEPLPPAPDTEDHVEVTRMIENALRLPAPGKAAEYPRSVKVEIARHASRRLGWSYERIAELLGFKSANSVEYMLIGRKDRPRTRGGR